MPLSLRERVPEGRERALRPRAITLTPSPTPMHGRGEVKNDFIQGVMP